MSFRRSRVLLSALALALAATGPAAFAHGRGHGNGGFAGLNPGEFVTHELEVPVRVVLIGFDRAAVDTGQIAALLPPDYTPVVRYPQFYGLDGRDLGLEYKFDYEFVWKDQRFTDRFFRHLARIGEEAPRTFYQTEYNNQVLNVVDVPETVLFVDAPRVERWLKKQDEGWSRHDRRGHGSCRDDHGYTIYFINWYGRDDFQFHVYTKTDEPDPDTEFNFGANLSSRKVRAWGGTSSRSWFFDFSAGPEYNDGSYVVDDAAAPGSYRIPAIWEYATPGYRSADLLSADMGLLARFVAINLLFTSSPLYDPLVTAPEPWGRKIARVTMLEDDPDPAENGVDWFDPYFSNEELRRFQPYYRWRVAFQDVDPIDDGAKAAFDTFTGTNVQPGCWEDPLYFNSTFASLFCYFDGNLDSYVPGYRSRDYVAPVFSFNTTDAGMGSQLGLLGFADDNWMDGTQSYVFTFNSPLIRQLGYGFTATTVHEVGHHIGLSHPHDGYDPLFGDYGTGDLYFAWSGDESDTVMHYITLSNGFGVHNQDNMYRWEAAGYLNRANIMAGDLLASRHSWRCKWVLQAADRHAARALRALEKWDYLEAVTEARWAWALLSKAAEDLGVSSARLDAAQVALPDAERPKGCRPRFPEN